MITKLLSHSGPLSRSFLRPLPFLLAALSWPSLSPANELALNANQLGSDPNLFFNQTSTTASLLSVGFSGPYGSTALGIFAGAKRFDRRGRA